jgi:hypothetical protein
VAIRADEMTQTEVDGLCEIGWVIDQVGHTISPFVMNPCQ